MARKKSSLKQLSDIGPYLTTSGAKKKLINYRFYLQTGAVKIAVTCSAGRGRAGRAFVFRGFLRRGMHCGSAWWVSTATALESSSALEVEKEEMIRVIHA